MKLACFQSNKGLRQLPFRQFVQQASDLGYDAIDIPFGEPGAADFCRSLNLSVNSAGPLFLPDLSKSTERQEEISTKLRSAIDSASDQDVPSITLLIGRDVSLNGDDNIAIFADLFTPLAAYAEQRQVRLAFENWPRNGTMLAIT
ncbi:MAG: sugar phosphate isomerase/epimerase family protein, partial [Caldilinea sp.]